MNKGGLGPEGRGGVNKGGLGPGMPWLRPNAWLEQCQRQAGEGSSHTGMHTQACIHTGVHTHNENPQR